MLRMLLSTVYVLAFPTLMAMTGYITKTEPYVEDVGRNLVAMEKLKVVVYVVNDAKRIGYGGPLVVKWEDTALITAVERCTLSPVASFIKSS
jgi:hypothetical protein